MRKTKDTKNKTFTAYYIPALTAIQKDPSRSGFSSEKMAEKYIISQICEACKADKNKEWAGMRSPCAAEWLVIPEDLFKEGMGTDDLFKAAGYKQIYKYD